MDIRDPELDAGVIHKIAGGKVVGAIDYEIVARKQSLDVTASEPGFISLDGNGGV